MGVIELVNFQCALTGSGGFVGVWFAVDESSFVGVDDDLDAVAGSEFGEDVADVGLDGFGPDKKVIGDLKIGAALCHEVEHLALSAGEAL